MRIVGYIEDKPCKITVFHQGLRFMVKFEDGLYEQAFKFRESEQIGNLKDILKLIDDDFISEVMIRFSEMRKSTGILLERYLGSNDQDEEEII